MASYHFVVYGNPKALKRHRTIRAGKFTREYDPSLPDKKDFVAAIQDNAPKFLITQPVEVNVYAYFGRPVNHFGTGKNTGKIKSQYASPVHSKNPDVDNILKFVMDALTGVFWKDDRIIYKATIVKLYDHEKPRVEVFVNTV